MMARLGDVCEVLNGFAFKSEKYVDNGIRIIRIANVQKGVVEDFSPVFYPETSSEAQKYRLENGDLLISLTGNVGRVALLTEDLLPAALNQRVACLRIKQGVKLDKAYLFNFLNSDFFEQKCVEAANGVAQKNMSTEWLKNYEIPIPSILRQQEIATILDHVSILCKAHNDQLSKLDELVKSRFIELFGDPIANDRGWAQVPLSECVVSIDNGKSFVCSTDTRTGEWPAILKLSAATYGYYRPEENKALLDESQYIEAMSVHAGDLLFTRKNTPELVGMCAYVYDTPQMLMMPDLIFRLNTTDSCNKIFLWKLINHDLFRDCIQNIATGSAKSMSNISKERLLGLEVILPPMALQEQFAAFVEQTDKSKFEVKNSIEKLETLKKSLMQKYFQ